LPTWAELGIDGLNALAAEEWQLGRRGFWTLPKKGLFYSSSGPLWDRSLARGGPQAHRNLRRSLALIGAKRMIVGHTQTASLRGGQAGHIKVLAAGKLIAIDVGLTSGPDTPRAALILEGPRGYEWTPTRTRLLWR
jgi:hypothetical protein